MTLPEVLNDDLTALSDALDDPSADLTGTFRALADHLAESIPSFVNVTLMVLTQDRPVVHSSTTRRNQEVRGSLLLSLSPQGISTTCGTITFASTAPGAFTSLADAARWIFNLDGPPIEDGRYLPAHPSPSCRDVDTPDT
jgi:hypothetical protein